MSDYFRIMRGLEIDESVRFLQGSGMPGSTADTDAAQVGSVYVDRTTGKLYSKTSSGSGTIRWQAVAAGANSLYNELATSPTFPAAQGANSIALGSGAQTDVDASNSIAIGDQSLARLHGGMVQANGRFQTTGDAQSGRYLLRTHTINNQPTEAFLDGTAGSARLILPDNSTWTFTATITGHRTDQSGGHAGYKMEGVVYRDAGAGTVSFLGKPIKTVLAESNTPWDINIQADSTHGSLSITVTGQNGKTIRWLALVETVEITN